VDPLLSEPAIVEVKGVAFGAGPRLVQRDISFDVLRGQIVVITGESGAGKTALLHAIAGLEPPTDGDVLYCGESLWTASYPERNRIAARSALLPTGGALLSIRTLLDNVALPLRVHTHLPVRDVQAVARLELALMGLAGFEHHYPSEVNAHQRALAGLARATALDPEILLLDEPTAGLDPWEAMRISEEIIRIREDLGATVVMASNDLALVFAADQAVFLDLESKTMKARGNPRELRDASPDAHVRAFLKGGRP
jgi:phospholipid/cholesterol/gamma-HCH transport system ATP-binding protein